MSISKFQEKLFNKGCGTVILISCAAVFGGLAFSYWGKASQYGGNDAEGHPAKVIATLVGKPVDATQVDQLVLQQQQQQDQQGAGANSQSPQAQANLYGEILDNALQGIAIGAIAKSNGIQFTDDQIKTAVTDELKRSIDMNKMQLMMNHQLKEGATDADFEAYIKSKTGKSLQDLENQRLTELTADLKDPQKRDQLIQQLGAPVLTSVFAAKIKPSDAELKASYDSDTFKRILLTEKPSPSPSVDARVETVQKDLSSGTPFEQEMDRYSDETPLPKKKVSDSVTTMDVDRLASDPTLAPLKTLKVGAVSEPIKAADGVSIYKLVSVKNMAPADFDKNIAKYRQQFQQRTAATQFDAEVKSLVATKTEWSSKGYKAVYDVTRPDVDASKASALFDEAKTAVTKGEGFDLRPAQLAEYKAFDMIWTAPGADKSKLTPQRIEVLNDYLTNMESFDVRMELVGLYQAEKNGPLAVSSLIAAARSNNQYDQIGQSHFGDIEGRIITLKASGLLTPDDQKAVEQVQAQWKSDKAGYDAEKTQAAAEEAKARAEAEADRKKAEDAAKKAAKANPPAPSTGATGSTAGGSGLTKPPSGSVPSTPAPGPAPAAGGKKG